MRKSGLGRQLTVGALIGGLAGPFMAIMLLAIWSWLRGDSNWLEALSILWLTLWAVIIAGPFGVIAAVIGVLGIRATRFVGPTLFLVSTVAGAAVGGTFQPLVNLLFRLTQGGNGKPADSVTVLGAVTGAICGLLVGLAMRREQARAAQEAG